MKAVYRVVSLRSGVGKTRLACELIRALSSRGVMVSAVKHCHREVQLAERDAERMLVAGAKASVAVSESLVVAYERGAARLEDLVEGLPGFVVVVEGFRRARLGKKIVVAEGPEDVRELGGDDVLCVVARSEEARREAESRGYKVLEFGDVESLAEMVYEDALARALSALPGLNCGRCGYSSCVELALRVLEGSERLSRCPRVVGVRVVVDGELVPLNPYVKRLVSSVVTALVSTLKGVPEKPRRILVELEL